MLLDIRLSGRRYGSMQRHLPQEDIDMPEQVEVVVIGGGQAGLAISYYLTQQGRPHVVLERPRRLCLPGGTGGGTPLRS
jgi:ribulose 1,5-bisphosphate synthetase/thiazole synthase